MANLRSHVLGLAQPQTGNRCFGCSAFTGTVAAVSTLATTQNSERSVIIHQRGSWWDPSYLIGWLAAIRQKNEEVTPRYSFDWYRDPLWNPPAAPDENSWLDANDLDDLTTDGVWTIQSNRTGSFSVMALTTRSKDPTGTYDEFGAAEPHRVVIIDEVAEDLQQQAITNFAGWALRDDERLADGSVDANQRIAANTLTPSVYGVWAQGNVIRRLL